MRFEKPISVQQIAQWVNGIVVGNPNVYATGINEIHRVEAGDICFVDHPKYYRRILESPASVILIDKAVDVPDGKALIVVESPFIAFNQLLRKFREAFSPVISDKPTLGKNVQIGQQVVFGKNVIIEDEVIIGHQVTIGSNVYIGRGTIIYPGARIGDYVQIGQYCRIQYGVVIGGLPFYYKRTHNGRIPMENAGGVWIGDYVDIGANTTIDSGVSAPTMIGDHTKIDNLVQVGHDTIIGKRCVIAAQVGIAGCVVIEDDVTLWGQVGIPSGIRVGKGAVLLAKAGVMSDVPAGKTYFGAPAKEHVQKWRELAALSKLPLWIKEAESKVEQEE